MLSDFVSAYRKSFGSKHILISLIKDWKNIFGAALTDLSKAFDCIQHDLLIG